MPNQLADRILAGATYFFLLSALVSTTILICGCIPSAPGETSALDSFYAIRLHTPGISAQGLRLASFALCFESRDAVSCIITAGRKPAESLALLSQPANAVFDTRAVEVAYSLQKEVIYGTPVLAALFFFFSLSCFFISQFFRALSPRRMRAIAVALAALGTAIMLVDAFSMHMVASALEIAGSEVVQGFQYEKGLYYMGFQWAAFALGFCGLSTLLYGSFKSKAQDPVLPA
ncbi:uncharacterized protein EI97DRAFT_441650 [Westerdykella ornata]|uniref:Uncharacterized protein n=1 Tax=Westerdykella ornata TaxID=318751 RepID=A0A6A6JNC5_WESOR|nr:uncharacterized protein EI97DRAFT_441650 [Westerdykella ornata]KAF2277623.1 hypothetical protein EI97DRAFT_441650 [Westerdykella ornata]